MQISDVEGIVLEAMDLHGCHTAILYGSWARGTATAESDIDVLLVRDAGTAMRDARVLNGVYLDAFVYPEAEFDELKPSLLRVLGGRVIREREGFGQALLAKLQQLNDSGPAPMADDERRAVVLWSRKMLDRIAGQNGVEASYRRMQLLTQALEDYFALRRMWFRGPREAFAWLSQFDSKSLGHFERAAGLHASSELLGNLVATVYGPWFEPADP
jgi:predicted nucleotidyltransferase